MSERSLHALALLAGVSLLKRRELGIPPGRCPSCAQRRDWIVVTDAEPLPPADGPCPRCQWQPTVIEVAYVKSPLPRQNGHKGPSRN